MPELNEEAREKIASLEEENQKLEKEVEPLYATIGKIYYEKPEGHEKEMEKAVRRLDAINKQIQENRIAILTCKGIRLCPNCGSEVEQGAIFCGECGIRMEAVKEVDENSVLCSRCGAKNEKGKKFCVICGQKLVDIIKAVEGDSVQSCSTVTTSTTTGYSQCEITFNEEETEESPVEAETKAEPEKEESKPLAEAAATEESSNEVNHPEPVVLASDTASEPVQALDVVEGAGMPQQDVIFCPECGNRLPADALFCTECGAKIETHQESSAPAEDMPMFCPECGTKLEPGSAFCAECGAPVSTGR